MYLSSYAKTFCLLASYCCCCCSLWLFVFVLHMLCCTRICLLCCVDQLIFEWVCSFLFLCGFSIIMNKAFGIRVSSLCLCLYFLCDSSVCVTGMFGSDIVRWINFGANDHGAQVFWFHCCNFCSIKISAKNGFSNFQSEQQMFEYLTVNFVNLNDNNPHRVYTNYF